MSSDGLLEVRIRARTLVDLDRAGLLFGGGGPPIDAAFRFRVKPKDGPPVLPLPVPLDYGYTTERSADGAGLVREVRVPLGSVVLPERVRVYLLVDTHPAVREEIDVR